MEFGHPSEESYFGASVASFHQKIIMDFHGFRMFFWMSSSELRLGNKGETEWLELITILDLTNYWSFDIHGKQPICGGFTRQ